MNLLKHVRWVLNIDPISKRPKLLGFLLNLNFWKNYFGLYSGNITTSSIHTKKSQENITYFLSSPIGGIVVGFWSIFLEFSSEFHHRKVISFLKTHLFGFVGLLILILLLVISVYFFVVLFVSSFTIHYHFLLEKKKNIDFSFMYSHHHIKT